MANNDTEVAIIGGGAAGVAAGRRLAQAAIDCLVVEARPRLGGRAYSVDDGAGNVIDLGCGWLHSADRNPWVKVAEAQGRTIDKSMPPWQRRALPVGFPPGEQEEFGKAQKAFFDRLEAGGEGAGRAGVGLSRARAAAGTICSTPSPPISAAPSSTGCRSTISIITPATKINWRIVEGYGTDDRRLRRRACAACSIARCCRSTTAASG